MLLIRLLRFLRGTVTFEVKGKFSERFLNLLSRNGIPVFCTCYQQDGFTAQTLVKRYFLIRPFVRKTHVKVRVTERKGLPFLIKKYSKRIGLLLGVFVFLLGVYLSGEFVWEIQINGNQTISDDEVLQSLEEQGLTRGSWKRSLDVSKIAMNLRHQYHQIGWAAVNLVGSIAQVEINERIEGNEVLEDKTPCNIVASRGGQIVSMEVYDGQKVVKKGDVVKKGEMIVSGIVKGSTGKAVIRHARAKVMAEYPESCQIKIPLSQTLQVPVGGMRNYRYLKIGSVHIPMFIAGEKPEKYFERTFKRPIKLCGITLPFDMIIHQVIPAQSESVKISKEKAEEFAEKQLNEYEVKQPDRKVVSRKIKKQVTRDSLIVNAEYIFCSDIANQEEILFNGSSGLK